MKNSWRAYENGFIHRTADRVKAGSIKTAVWALIAGRWTLIRRSVCFYWNPYRRPWREYCA